MCLLVVGLELHWHAVGWLLKEGEVEELLVEAIAQQQGGWSHGRVLHRVCGVETGLRGHGKWC
jgi:hypothetical protein